ncbi:MAG: hypothetical protein ASARMPREDX12_002066 [Alectoria sarmentosa]|nr:MAG: hypothetical protein ASARMPREDX12_002066 [Alectoria sarmentosa]
MSSNPSAANSRSSAMGRILEVMRANLLDVSQNLGVVGKNLEAASQILEIVSENMDAMDLIDEASSTKPTVWVVNYTATNWQCEIETPSHHTPLIHGGKIQAATTTTTTAPTYNTVGIYQSEQLAKEAGQIWARKQRERRLDAYDPPLADEQQARLDASQDWDEAEYPELLGQELLDGSSSRNWATFRIRRRDDSEELGVGFQEWVVKDSASQ